MNKKWITCTMPEESYNRILHLIEADKRTRESKRKSAANARKDETTHSRKTRPTNPEIEIYKIDADPYRLMIVRKLFKELISFISQNNYLKPIVDVVMIHLNYIHYSFPLGRTFQELLTVYNKIINEKNSALCDDLLRDIFSPINCWNLDLIEKCFRMILTEKCECPETDDVKVKQIFIYKITAILWEKRKIPNYFYDLDNENKKIVEKYFELLKRINPSGSYNIACNFSLDQIMHINNPDLSEDNIRDLTALCYEWT